MNNVNLTIKESEFNTREAYKALRTNILFCGADIKVIVITSCLPGEGKSTVSFNIAKNLADDGKKVMYIDADMRKSVMLSRLKIGKKVLGLSHYLSGQNELDEVTCETNVENFHAIFAGTEPPNPAELLGNKRFESAINFLRESYDYIIVDSPPMGNVADCAVISKVCDGIIMVISSRSTSSRLAKSIKQQLERTNCKILGAVLNKIDVRGHRRYYNYYGGAYYLKRKYYGYYTKKGSEDIIEE